MQLAFIRNPSVLLAAALGILSLCFASPQRASAEPGVARISDMQGSVAVQRGDSNQAVAATVNAPVLGADYVTTGNNSRAQIDLDGASSVRLGSGVQMRFSNLDPGSRRLQLAQGPVDLRVFRANDLATQIDTPSISVRPREPGSYRVNVTPDGRTWVVVRSGAADVITPQGTRTVGPGATLVAAGSASNPSISTEGAVAVDAFDNWNGQRDQYWQAAAPSDTYVDPNIVGVDDLQQYGRWQDDPAYGNVWIPNNEPAGWSPYQTGRWVWEDGYGWTWVAAEPWGWAPYHYGSWYRSRHGWAWYPPGPAVVAPVWQPALVAFISFGGGSGISLALNLGDPGYNVGWVPLAPFEPYYPWYGNGGYGGYGGYGGPAYINQVTVINNPGAYRNYRYGVTAVSGQQFAAGQFGHPQRYALGQMRNARAFRGAVPLAPTAANLRFGASNVARQLQVAPNVARMRFAGNASVTSRTPFTQTRTALASGIGRARVQTVAARFATPTTPSAIHAAAARMTAARMTPPRSTAGRPNVARTITQPNVARQATRPNGAYTAARPNFARTATQPNFARTATRPNVARTAPQPNVARGPLTNPAWQRFGNQRGVQVGPRGVASRSVVPVTGAARANATAHVRTAPGTFGTTANLRGTPNTTTRAHVATAPRTYSAPAHTYAAPARTAPVARTYSAPARTYVAPARTYTAPARTYTAPARTYSAPARTYTAPARTYSAPARTYTAPARTYVAPAAPVARTYSAPARTYAPPARTYAPPARTYVAPARSAPAPAPARQAPPARGGASADRQHPPR